MQFVFAVILTTLGTAVLFAWFVWWLQVRTPRRVRWRATVHDGVAADVADGLVLQYDDGTHVWASCGYSIYRSSNGGDFRRVARIRPPWGEAWGGYLSALRTRYGYQELVEVLPLRGENRGRLVVFAGGWAHRVDVGDGWLRRARVRRTLKLRWFGRGKGRGLMPFGLDQGANGDVWFSEYVTEGGDHPTGVWRSQDEGATWTLAYEFAPGAIRHIHCACVDEHDGALWIGTGDRDEHCFVGRSGDDARTFEWVGHGRQIHRTCAVVSFADVVVWPMDADFEQNHLVRWHRSTGVVTVDAELPDASYGAVRIDDERLLIGVCQGVAQVWVGDRHGRARRWLDYPVSGVPPVRGPSPGIRLARGPQATGSSHVHVGVLRSLAWEAAVWRCVRDDVPSATAGAPTTDASS